jgi:hypothetical protein
LILLHQPIQHLPCLVSVGITDFVIREPLKIHFGGQANLFDFGRRQAKATLASTKADLPSLPKTKNLHLTAQKQLLELPLIFMECGRTRPSSHLTEGLFSNAALCQITCPAFPETVKTELIR